MWTEIHIGTEGLGIGKVEQESTEKNCRKGHLCDELDTQCNRNSQEFIRVSLAKTTSNGRYGA